METISAIVIIIAVAVGFTASYFTKQVDSPVEQVAEAVLRVKGVEIDFSADAKARAALPPSPEEN